MEVEMLDFGVGEPDQMAPAPIRAALKKAVDDALDKYDMRNMEETLSALISPHLRSGQILLVSPGYAGSFYFSTKCKGKDVVFAEGESLPFDSRIIAPGKVNICFENIRNPVGFFRRKKLRRR